MSSDRIEIADGVVDPALHLASAPFAMWIGTIQVDPAGDAHLLRSSGEEDRIPGHASHAALVEAALRDLGVPVEPGTGAWLPLAALYPVLAHLNARDAFDVATRMPAPRAERVDPPAPRRPLELRAALLDGVPGWAGACQPTPSA